jgi:putative membrane protein
MKRHHLLATAALVLFTAPTLSLAQTPTPTAKVTEKGQLAQQDMTFANKAAISDMFEIQAGKLAQDQAKDKDVKQFGSHMVSDHTKTSDAMKEMAQKKSMTLPTKLDSEHQQKLDKLRGMKGEQFDSAYMQGQVDAHQTAVSLFRDEAQNGKDADLKRFAEQTLPTLEQHLRQARDQRPAVASAGGAAAHQEASIEKMMGKDVYGENGKKLGDVADIILDAQTGKATQVILNRGGVLGIGAKQVALDYNLLRADGDRIVARQVTEDQVKQMAEFKYDDNTVSLGKRHGDHNTGSTGSNANHSGMSGGDATHGTANSLDSTKPRNPQ